MGQGAIMSENPGLPGRGGDVERIRAEAVGEPGNRRFRLLAVIEGDTRIVWMEKEQLRRLGEALAQVLIQLPDRGRGAGAANQPGDFDLESRLQFRAGRMELGYDEDRDLLIVIAHDLEADDDAQPAFACRISRAQADELSQEAATVVAAGRPLCPLCGRAIGPGPHICAKQNGHFPEQLDEVTDEEDELEEDEEQP
jgi:uncharacterized repeat protein (TIGR03847 family)